MYRPRRILVPHDGSTLASSALPTALELARRSGAELHLVTAVPPAPPFVAIDSVEGLAAKWLEVGSRHADEALSALSTELEALAEGLGGGAAGAAPRILPRVIPGKPVSALHDYVLEEGIDLIVMTSHGQGGVERAWLGSVADGLVRRSPAAVLLVRPTPDSPFQAQPLSISTVLVPLDGSPLAEAILPRAHALAELLGAKLRLLRVIPPLEGTIPLPPAWSHLEVMRQAEEELHALAHRLRAEGSPAGGKVVPIETKVLSGWTPAEGIGMAAVETPHTLVALSTHGRGGLERALLGSVADKVIRSATTPVLVQRARLVEGWD